MSLLNVTIPRQEHHVTTTTRRDVISYGDICKRNAKPPIDVVQSNLMGYS